MTNLDDFDYPMLRELMQECAKLDTQMEFSKATAHITEPAASEVRDCASAALGDLHAGIFKLRNVLSENRGAIMRYASTPSESSLATIASTRNSVERGFDDVVRNLRVFSELLENFRDDVPREQQPALANELSGRVLTLEAMVTLAEGQLEEPVNLETFDQKYLQYLKYRSLMQPSTRGWQFAQKVLSQRATASRLPKNRARDWQPPGRSPLAAPLSPPEDGGNALCPPPLPELRPPESTQQPVKTLNRR